MSNVYIAVSVTQIVACDTHLLATPTMILKMPHGRCVNRVKHPLLRLFSTRKQYMKRYFACLYAIIGMIYTV